MRESQRTSGVGGKERGRERSRLLAELRAQHSLDLTTVRSRPEPNQELAS